LKAKIATLEDAESAIADRDRLEIRTASRYTCGMINIGSCQNCGRQLLPGARADMIFCGGACRAAHFRAVRAGGVLPFTAPSLPTVLSDDDQKAMDAIAQSVRAHPANTPEAALARVWAAEKQLQAARREASNAFEAVGRESRKVPS
jgi:hypothetical protein